MKLLAKVMSYLFHPVLFFLIMPFLVVYKETSNSLYAVKWMMFSSAFVIFGVMVVFFETMKGNFSDFDISIRRQRSQFFITALILGLLYLAIALFFKGFVFPLSIMALGIALGISTFAIINRFIKASIHVGVVCAFVISISIIYGLYTLPYLILLIPVVAWSRLVLRRHSIVEVLTGGVAGTLITIVTFLIGRIFI